MTEEVKDGPAERLERAMEQERRTTEKHLCSVIDLFDGHDYSTEIIQHAEALLRHLRSLQTMQNRHADLV